MTSNVAKKRNVLENLWFFTSRSTQRIIRNRKMRYQIFVEIFEKRQGVSLGVFFSQNTFCLQSYWVIPHWKGNFNTNKNPLKFSKSDKISMRYTAKTALTFSFNEWRKPLQKTKFSRIFCDLYIKKYPKIKKKAKNYISNFCRNFLKTARG